MSNVRPLASIIVPVYRHWSLVPALLEALSRQSCQDFEVIIADNETEDMLPPSASENVRVIRCATPGAYAARNQAAEVARGTWLVFTDADCIPAPRWLAALTLGTPAELRAGPVRMMPPAQHGLVADYDLVRGIPQKRYVDRGYAATANLAVPAASFRELGGFDAARLSGGDAEFCRRAGRAGIGLTFVPEAEVAHPCRDSWAEVIRKARRIRGGQVRAGSLSRRMAWTLAGILPPIGQTARFLRSPHEAHQRRNATVVLWILWAVQAAETVRLLAGRAPQR